MSTRAWWITGNTLDVLRKMPDDSVDFVMTSPPFLALRSYLPADDPAKAHEIGSEATPGEFLDVMLDITEELRRVVAPHGSIAVELGDTYSGSGGAGGDYGPEGLRDGQPRFKSARKDHVEGWPADKSLALIPELYRIALAYGRNPLTGRETPRWRVRNVVRWVRPNPPVGALGDKFRPATSDIVIACGTDEAGRRRYFGLDAVRHEATDQRTRQTNGKKMAAADPAEVQTANYSARVPSHPAGAPPLDWWEISPKGYPGSHYATYPEDLCLIPVKAMCPERVCTVCGDPSRRIVQADADVRKANRAKSGYASRDGREDGSYRGGFTSTSTTTLGWSDCGHDSWRPGRVLDPFGGTGTTLAVATKQGRDAIGIDLDARNTAMADERVRSLLAEFIETDADDLDEILRPVELAQIASPGETPTGPASVPGARVRRAPGEPGPVGTTEGDA